MRDAVDKWEGRIGIGGRVVTNLRCADDTCNSNRWNKGMPRRKHGDGKGNKRESGPNLNALKTKVMTTGDMGEVTVDLKIVEVVTSFIFLGASITSDGLCDKEIRRRIAMGKAAMGGL